MSAQTSLSFLLLCIVFLTHVIPTCQVISYGTLTPPATNHGMGFGEYKHADPECKALHDTYWTHGDDGKVYPTWHPPSARTKSGKTCHFGHEHGHDPRLSKTFGNRPFPFGYVNDVYASWKKTSERHEDHVGHKIHLKNDIRVNNDRTKQQEDTCDVVMKAHMGVHSPDAFTNNLHEVFTFLKCEQGRHAELKFLQAFGVPGQFIVPDRCPNGRKPYKADLSKLKISPPDSPEGMGDRMIADANCAEYLFSKREPFTRLMEHWVMGNSFRLKVTNDKGKTDVYGVNYNPYFMVINPIRYYDPNRKTGDKDHPPYTSYFTELCWENNARSNDTNCLELKKEFKNPAESWKSCKSPYKGTVRRFSPNRIGTRSPPGGPHTVYTDALFNEPSLEKFDFAIKQVIGGTFSPQGSIGLDVVDFDSPSVCGPN